MNTQKRNLPKESEMCGNGKGGAGMNTYQVIDEKNWERAMHCMVFRESVEPAFCVTFEADITNFRRKVKAQNLSFTLAFVYAVCKCADEVEAFRCGWDTYWTVCG